MRISIVCVGKIKEKFYTQAIAEYAKRLSRYCNLNIIEVADEKTKEQATENEIAIVKQKRRGTHFKIDSGGWLCDSPGYRWKNV